MIRMAVRPFGSRFFQPVLEPRRAVRCFLINTVRSIPILFRAIVVPHSELAKPFQVHGAPPLSVVIL
jgi:hypothetical protein